MIVIIKTPVIAPKLAFVADAFMSTVICVIYTANTTDHPFSEGILLLLQRGVIVKLFPQTPHVVDGQRKSGIANQKCDELE